MWHSLRSADDKVNLVIYQIVVSKHTGNTRLSDKLQSNSLHESRNKPSNILTGL